MLNFIFRKAGDARDADQTELRRNPACAFHRQTACAKRQDIRRGMISSNTSGAPGFASALLTFVCWAFVSAASLSSPLVVADEMAELQATIMPLIDAHDGQVAVRILHLETGQSFDHRGDTVMPTASLIKLAVMVEAYRQAQQKTIALDELLELRLEDQVPGSGILTKHFGAGSRLTLRDAIRLMIAYSDNTATNLVVDRIGIEATATAMAELGLPDTKLHSKVYRGDTSVFPERSKQYGLGSTTANQTVALLQHLHQGTVVTKAACEEMLDHLKHCEDKSKLTKFLPAGTVVAHKSGAVSKTRCDAGILYTSAGPIAICVLTSENSDQSWDDSNAAEILCGRIAKSVLDHFAPPQPASTAGVGTLLQAGAYGRAVEAVQRTLNARMDPSPDLSIDGDFGPATQAAVVQFQTQNKLSATGIVASETWKALSPLITERLPVPEPDQVNSEVLPLESADTLDGPPIVSCKAWAVADAVSGEILHGHDVNRSLDIASTTKIMTAYLVLRAAATRPEILEEVVTFTRRADRTRGSTSAVEEGESLPVHELLYGLLLPSGNDAAVALAEHFGARVATQLVASEAAPGAQTSPPDTEPDSLLLFVKEMNNAAQSLNMQDTIYRNPHGLTEEGHRSTAADLIRLTHAALQLPRFRNYIGTRQRGCTITGPGGYTRNVLWKNTNRLLQIEGYGGVKTGTTSDAGACLVSLGVRGDVQRMLVVLGSESSAGRYVDTRNLFRWAWGL